MTLFNSAQFNQWQPSSSMRCIETLDCHTGGEPLRIITRGWPTLKGDSILAKRRDCQQQYDHLRTALMHEPRGHHDMYGAILVDAERDDSHFGAIFIHNEGYSTMCGHAVIALAKFAVESGVVAQTGKQTSVNIDVPCGQIKAIAYQDQNQLNRVSHVSFEGVPSFVFKQKLTIELESIGTIHCDLAFGGAFYAYVDVTNLAISLDKTNHQQLMQLGQQIKQQVNQQLQVIHPVEQDLSFLYGTIFYQRVSDIHYKNVCIFADGELDRSPTGSGACAHAALAHITGQLAPEQSLTISSIINSEFQVTIKQTQDYFGYSAVIPQVSGTAHIFGKNQWWIDDNDPLKHGFLLSQE